MARHDEYDLAVVQDADYRTRFGGNRLLPLTMRIVLRAVIVAALAVLSLALVVVSGR